MPNLYVLSYLVVSVVCMLAMGYVIIRQFGEVRRPKNAFTRLRWYLLFFPSLIFVSLSLGLPRLVANLHTPITDGWTIIRVFSGIMILLVITLLIIGIYTYREKR